MKQYLLLFALVISLSVSAQITIQNTDMPKGGTIYLMSNGNPANIKVSDLQVTGANQNWNFNLQAVSQAYDTSYSMNQVPIAFQFVFFGSTYADRLSQNLNLGIVSITNIYSFYKVNSSMMEETGTGANISGLPLPTLYNPKDVVYRFPMNFGNADSCNSAFSTTVPTIGSWMEGRKRVNEIDGWGTLQTPLGSKDVLRVRADVYYNDTIKIDTPISLPPLSFPRHQVEYKWLAKSGGFPMLEVITTVAAGTETVTQVIYQDTLNTTSVANVTYNANVRVYPQPAENNFIISSPGDIIDAVSVYDMCGRVIKRINGIGQTFMNISTSDIPAGLYPVILQGRNKNYTAKISVIH